MSGVAVCARCGVGFQRVSSMGPEPKFCSHTCRQRAYEDRRDKRALAALAVAKEALTRIDERGQMDGPIVLKRVTRDALARIAELEGQ